MKKFAVSTVLAISAFCFLSWLSPLKVYASPVNMKFVGPGGPNSGGVYTYPYEFEINGGPQVSLLCVSYQDEIQQGETWKATITPIGDVAYEEEDAYLDNVILNTHASATTISEAQWAAWVVGDPGYFNPPTPLTPAGFTPASFHSMDSVLDGLGLSSEVSGINNEYELAYESVVIDDNTVKTDPTFYAGYELYVPEDGTQSWGGDPQTFIGPAPTPEPSSLILLGSGLLTAAGALYRRKRRTA